MIKSMFASNTAEVLTFSNSNPSKDLKMKMTRVKTKTKTGDLFSKILFLHKKLKEVAQYESISRSKYKLAKLDSSQLEKIKNLEGETGYSLIAYSHDTEVEENKDMILNRVYSLLEEYLDYCKPSKTQIKDVGYKFGKSEDAFSGFFEQ